VLTTLRTAEEVRSLDEVARPDLPKPDAAMLQIAEKIVEQQSGDFDPLLADPPPPAQGFGRGPCGSLVVRLNPSTSRRHPVSVHRSVRLCGFLARTTARAL
jgi:hypothetical protein